MVSEFCRQPRRTSLRLRRRRSRLRSPRRWLNLPGRSTGNARRTLAAYPVEAETLANFRSARHQVNGCDSIVGTHMAKNGAGRPGCPAHRQTSSPGARILGQNGLRPHGDPAFVTRQAGWACAAACLLRPGCVPVRYRLPVKAREVRFVGKASRSQRLKKNKDHQRCRAAQAAGQDKPRPPGAPGSGARPSSRSRTRLGWSPAQRSVPPQREFVSVAVGEAARAVCRGDRNTRDMYVELLATEQAPG
jgi:hypothetical protein